MSGKKKPAGKQIALCLLLTAAVDGLGVLLVTLLAVKGIVGEDRVPQALGALAFCAAFAGGLPAGKGRLGPGGSLLNAGAFCTASAFALLRRLGRGDRGPGADPAGSDPAGRAAGGAALRKGGEAVQQAIGEISQKAAFRLKKRRPVGRRSFFCGVVRYGKILRGIDTTSCVK